MLRQHYRKQSMSQKMNGVINNVDLSDSVCEFLNVLLMLKKMCCLEDF